jgi:hypothetical protein
VQTPREIKKRTLLKIKNLKPSKSKLKTYTTGPAGKKTLASSMEIFFN